MLTLTIRPVSAFCNARCRYCYHEDDVLVRRSVMSEEHLRTLVEKYQRRHRAQCRYVWHGGEPTIAGLAFYQRAVALQREYRATPQQKIRNTIQSNGWLFDERWAEFLRAERFDVGVSLDGPEHLNDPQRGADYYRKTMRAIRMLQEKNVPFSCICVVTGQTVEHPDELFDFFIDAGITRVSFNPIFGEHPGYDVDPLRFADFLNRIFDRWIERADPRYEIRFLRESVVAMLGGTINLCTMQGGCQNHLIVEHDGTLLPCHSYAGDKRAVGHLDTGELEVAAQHTYFDRVQTFVDEHCSSCRWYSLCGGDCVRFIDAPDNQIAGSSFCQARKRMFGHIEKKLLAAGMLASEFHGEGKRHQFSA